MQSASPGAALRKVVPRSSPSVTMFLHKRVSCSYLGGSILTGNNATPLVCGLCHIVPLKKMLPLVDPSFMALSPPMEKEGLMVAISPQRLQLWGYEARKWILWQVVGAKKWMIEVFMVW